jgi:hypothetical protein
MNVGSVFEKYKNACKYSKTLIFWFGTSSDEYEKRWMLKKLDSA